MNVLPFTGKAVFVSLPSTLTALRSQNKAALLSGQLPCRYLVLAESLVYQDCHLEQMLLSPTRMEEAWLELTAGQSASVPNALCCIALHSAESNRGALICRRHGQWQGAYLPLLTAKQAAQEQACAQKLLDLANNEALRRFDLPLALGPGKQSIAEILTALSEMLQA